MAGIPPDPKLRTRVIEMISFEAGLEFPVTESDFHPEHRQEISELVQMLERQEAALRRAQRAELEARSAWWSRKRKDALTREWMQSSEEADQLRKEISKRVSTMANSIRKYALTPTHVDFQRLLDALRNKGIVLEKIECPHCGGILKVTEVPKKEEMLECKYCGRSILAINLFEKFKEILKP